MDYRLRRYCPNLVGRIYLRIYADEEDIWDYLLPSIRVERTYKGRLIPGFSKDHDFGYNRKKNYKLPFWITCGIDINMTDIDGSTLLHISRYWGQSITYCINAGVKVNTKDFDGDTAMDKLLKTPKFLLENGR